MSVSNSPPAEAPTKVHGKISTVLFNCINMTSKQILLNVNLNLKIKLYHYA